MNKIFFSILLIILLSNYISGQNAVEKYSSITNWSGTNKNGEIIISGEIRIQVTFEKIKNGYHIRVQKVMTPYGQILDIETEAVKKDNYYIFSCMDNRQNNIFGSFKFENDISIFYLDCIIYSVDGKNLGRLYGDTHNL